ncbi:MFS transporter [Pseudoprimorskyibacter insulae]|uniref:Putative MFS-type transporter YhjX n=1 Tax=Pseudoprimorskyibacter insulae TaxID=1695997 RepID=A0A2R8AUN2_9RHOB|nr:MFS transporter [Pseudoprimorskyibacter insulae]SPF79617.1 putative MFS-type transporter YhjX [Pseudoprimorskyibacter insulae]
MEQISELDSRYSWVRLSLTLLIAITGNVGMWSIIVVMPDVQAEFGAGRAVSSLPYAVTMIGFAIGNLIIGRAVDRWGMAVSLFLAAGLMAAGYVVASHSPSLVALSAAQLAIGFGTSACFGPLISDISQWFQRRRGIAVAIAASGNYLAGAFWPLVLGWMAGDEGWRWIYMALAVLTVVLVMPMSVLLRRRVTELADAPKALPTGPRRAVLSPVRLQWLLGLAGVSCCVAMSMPQVHIVSLCVDYGFGATAGAEMLSLMLLGGVVSRVVSGMLADKLGGVRTLLIGSALQAVALFLYLPAGELASLYVVSLVFGLSQGGIVPSYAVIVREYLPAKEAGARIGFVMMMTIAGMALGGWMSGWIYDVTGNYQWAFLNGIAWNVLNVGIMLSILFAGRSAGFGGSAPSMPSAPTPRDI